MIVNEKDNLSKKWYFGRTSYCDIGFNLEKITYDCNENCIICNKDHIRKMYYLQIFIENQIWDNKLFL